MTQTPETSSFRRIATVVSYAGLVLALPLIAGWYDARTTPIPRSTLPGVIAVLLLAILAMGLLLRRFARALDRWPRLAMSDVFNLVFVVAFSLWIGLEFGGGAALVATSFLGGFVITSSTPQTRPAGPLPRILFPLAMVLSYLPFVFFCIYLIWTVGYVSPIAEYIFRMQDVLEAHLRFISPAAFAIAIGGALRPWKSLSRRQQCFVIVALSYAVGISLIYVGAGRARYVPDVPFNPKGLLVHFAMIVLGTLTLAPLWRRGLYATLLGLIVFWEVKLYTFF